MSLINCILESQIAINAELREQCVQWLLDVSSLWHNKQVTAPVAIQSFALHLASLLSPDDRIFVRLNYHNVYESLASKSFDLRSHKNLKSLHSRRYRTNKFKQRCKCYFRIRKTFDFVTAT